MSYHQRICATTKRLCNPARRNECLCWWESDSPEDFVRRSLAARQIAHGADDERQ